MGATTPTTGAFTTATLSSDLTLNGGTANGVLYLNGSKVATSGSALTFDGAQLGVNGITVGRGAGAVSTNTAVGSGALINNSTGVQNTAIGYQAGYVITTGGYNTAVGSSIMDQTAGVTGQENMAIGRVNMRPLTSGSYNTAAGNAALSALTTGSNNAAIGYQALQANTNASNNTAVGYQAGYNNTNGATNTYIGAQAGYYNVSGGYNTFLGWAAGFNSTGSFNTFIGARNGSGVACAELMTTGSRNTIIGGFSGNQNSLDIRTADNYIVLSDGDGNPLISTADNQTVALEGAVPNSGTGITFPATQSASSNANTLDDYEEGTWTPYLSDGTNTVSLADAYYTKIGNSVTCRFGKYNADISGLTAGAQLRLTGFPFPAAYPGQNFIFIGSITNNNPILCEMSQYGSTGLLYQGASGAGIGSLFKGDFNSSTNGSLWGNFVYLTST